MSPLCVRRGGTPPNGVRRFQKFRWISQNLRAVAGEAQKTGMFFSAPSGDAGQSCTSSGVSKMLNKYNTQFTGRQDGLPEKNNLTHKQKGCAPIVFPHLAWEKNFRKVYAPSTRAFAVPT